MNKDLFCQALKIMVLIFLLFIGFHIITNIIKSKNSICDSKKQSKFILECLNVNKTKELQASGACELIATRLYCK